MRDIVKEAQAIIDEFILASVETTREMQMKRYRKNRRRKMIAACIFFFLFLLSGGVLLYMKFL
ncbi:MAG: hypothetical protein HFI90_12660 [Clostridia bacterium]|nr:hypothetical protein [Clostridia bacterium]